MAESSLVDSAKRLYNRFTGATDRVPPRTDSSNRADAGMVREANESFRTAAQRDQKKRTAARSVRRKLTDANRTRSSGR